MEAVQIFKRILRKIIPISARHFLWSLIPKISRVNTLIIDLESRRKKEILIPDKYNFRQITWKDESQLRKFYDFTGPSSFNRKIPKRLDSERCLGFSFFDNSSGEIVYSNWVIHSFNNYLEEFPVKIYEPSFFWDSSFCMPEHRHMGLHSRMEQELFNYCEQTGIGYLYMQIHEHNIKGNEYALSNGYTLLNTSMVISWPFFDVYRNLNSFLRNPFRKIDF